MAAQGLKLLPLEAQIGQTGMRENTKLMKLHQTLPTPRVHPIPDDLFVTVRELIGKLE
jgi:hypothetical protein